MHASVLVPSHSRNLTIDTTHPRFHTPQVEIMMALEEQFEITLDEEGAVGSHQKCWPRHHPTHSEPWFLATQFWYGANGDLD
jgi:hypothetical protein